MKDKINAAFLAIFLGGFGAHKFYLNKTAQGCLYLVFGWTGLPAIISFFEGVSYLVMDEEEFDVKYNFLYHIQKLIEDCKK